MTPTHHVLLVEDNPDDEELTRRALQGHRSSSSIVVARDGAEAVEALLGDGPPGIGKGFRPAVVLLDLRLPKLDGFEVLARIRAEPRTRWQPVVILTSSSEDEDLLRGYSLGANSFIRKPVEAAKFVDAVNQLGVYWLMVNERHPGR